MTAIDTKKKRICILLIFFMVALAVSGLTAIPLNWEIGIIHRLAGPDSALGQTFPALGAWIDLIHAGLTVASVQYPFIAYGTDWLAFAHIVIAIAFIGPLRDPFKNLWVIDFGMIACLLIIPWALIFGTLRGIPVFWRVIDMSFGVIGISPLWLVRREILLLSQMYDKS